MGRLPLDENVVTDRLLRSWIRCSRKAWLEKHGDNQKRVWSPHRSLQLDHQQRSLSELISSKPGKGIEACKEGSYGVVGLRLKGVGPSGKLEAHPPLLQRIRGKSCWGEFAYRPVIARQGRKLTREHRLTLAFSGILLENLQQSKVLEGIAVCKKNSALEIQRIDLNQNLRRQLLESIKNLDDVLMQKNPPSLIADRRKCTVCSWKNLCDAEAAAQGFLSEVHGVGAKRQEILQGLGIETIEDLAKTNPIDLREKLKHYGDQHSAIAVDLVAQAKVQFYETIERLDLSQALPELRSIPGLLIYDIESDPDSREDFLHGFICISRSSNGHWSLDRASYQPILNLHESQEKLCWEKLEKKLTLYKDWPVIHYGETEVITLSKIAQRNGCNDEQLEELRKRCIDIHARLRSHWRLPLNNYGLKTVAGWIGFQWSQPNVSGARALFWWRQWKGAKKGSKGKLNSLQWICDYNKDDCLATWSVAKWLLNKDSDSRF